MQGPELWCWAQHLLPLSSAVTVIDKVRPRRYRVFGGGFLQPGNPPVGLQGSFRTVVARPSGILPNKGPKQRDQETYCIQCPFSAADPLGLAHLIRRSCWRRTWGASSSARMPIFSEREKGDHGPQGFLIGGRAWHLPDMPSSEVLSGNCPSQKHIP